MKNHKYILMDFYLYLLSTQHDPDFDLHQLMDNVRDALALKLDTNSQNVQNIFDRMIVEDNDYVRK
jgi:hypothetical protein